MEVDWKDLGDGQKVGGEKGGVAPNGIQAPVWVREKRWCYSLSQETQEERWHLAIGSYHPKP